MSLKGYAEENNNLGIRMKGGDESALSDFIDLNSYWMKGYAYNILKNHEDSEDVLIITFNHIWNKMHMWDPIVGDFSQWFNIVFKNKIVDLYRSNQRHDKGMDIIRRQQNIEIINSHKMHNIIDFNIVNEDILICIEKALEQVNTKMRICFILFNLEGYSHREISKILNMKEATVKINVYRAKESIKHILKLKFIDPEDFEDYVKD